MNEGRQRGLVLAAAVLLVVGTAVGQLVSVIRAITQYEDTLTFWGLVHFDGWPHLLTSVVGLILLFVAAADRALRRVLGAVAVVSGVWVLVGLIGYLVSVDGLGFLDVSTTVWSVATAVATIAVAWVVIGTPERASGDGQ